MTAAALPVRSLAVAGNRFLGAGTGFADHPLHTRETPHVQASPENNPADFVLAVAHLDAEHLPLVCCRNASGHDQGCGDHLLTGRKTMVEIRPIEVDVGVAAEFQRQVQEGLKLDVEVLQTLLTTDWQLPLSPPSATTSSTSLRTETP